jgi:hypothetical protein
MSWGVCTLLQLLTFTSLTSVGLDLLKSGFGKVFAHGQLLGAQLTLLGNNWLVQMTPKTMLRAKALKSCLTTCTGLHFIIGL